MKTRRTTIGADAPYEDGLGLVSSLASCVSDSALEDRLSNALATLLALPKVVLDLKFGLNGQEPLTLKQIAEKLNRELSPEIRAHLAAQKGVTESTIIITEAEVEQWEAEGLRGLRKCGMGKREN